MSKRTGEQLLIYQYHHARNEFDYRSRLVAVSDTLFYLTGNVSGFYKLTLDPRSGDIQFHP